MERVLVGGVKRYRQMGGGECAFAATASLANYYDAKVNYGILRSLVPSSKKRGEGLHTPQQGMLLNQLGFGNVTIVSADLSIFDFSWSRLSKKALVSKLKKFKNYWKLKDADGIAAIKYYIKWLTDPECDNQLKIDYNFPKYIRRHLNAGRPVGASFNWTAMFKLPKSGVGGYNDISGDAEEHAVVLRGYDKQGVFVVDSHHRAYKGKLSKYRSGRYKIPWSKFLVNAPYGDLILIN